jgi:hypothetical protein
MDETTIKGILARYSPPLSPRQMDEIAESVIAEWSKAEKLLKAVKTAKKLKAELKRRSKESKSSRMTRSKRG